MGNISRRSILALGAAAVPLAAFGRAAADPIPSPRAGERQVGGRDGVDRPPPTPFLVIPYTNGDTGARPLPVGTPHWNSQSILLDGAPYTGALLDPGKPIQLSAIVANLGALAATATVRFYWAGPTTAFTAATMNFISSHVFTLPAHAELESPAKPFVPSGAQPEHFCLFAEATTVLDTAPGTFDPAGDRHYAQQNLQRHAIAAGQQLTVPFVAVGTPAGRDYEISLQQVRDPSHALTIPSDHLRLKDLETGESGNTSLHVALEPDQRRHLQADITIPANAPTGASALLALVQRTMGVEPARTTGAIGIEIHVT